jgi:hypothetical protein
MTRAFAIVSTSHVSEMTMDIPTITTARLILRQLELADADAVRELIPRRKIVRFLASYVPWPFPPEGALTFIRDQALPAMRRGKVWHWSIRVGSATARFFERRRQWRTCVLAVFRNGAACG